MLIRNRGEKAWHEPETTRYASEKDLENLVKESPEVIPGVPSGPAAVITQLHVPDTGPADVMVIDVDGGITVIECKLRENPEVRRWVIGQVFSYASGIAQMTVDELNERWRARTVGADIVDSFRPALPDDVQESDLLARITDNLQAGRLRLVIAVDSMTEELKRTVTYINGHSGGTFELLALELKYVGDGDVEILVPTVYGEESAAHKAAAARGPVSGSRTALYQAFWAKYLERLHDEHGDWTTASVPSTANWMSMRAPIKGTFFSNSFAAGGKLRHELYIDAGDEAGNEHIYKSLEIRKGELEGAYGRPLTWEALPGKRACRLADYTEGDVTQEPNYDHFIDWLLDAGVRMRRALAAVLPLPALNE